MRLIDIINKATQSGINIEINPFKEQGMLEFVFIRIDSVNELIRGRAQFTFEAMNYAADSDELEYQPALCLENVLKKF